jgi:uncharacterized SAM-binding protein YcdF (DUF218 family)
MNNPSETSETTEPLVDARRPPREQWRQAAVGFAYGMSISMCGTLLGVYNLFRLDSLLLHTALLAALIGMTRARKCLPILAGALILLTLLIAHTPLMPALFARWERSDALPAGVVFPAVVVLSSHVQKAQTLDSQAQERMLRAYELLRTGQAQGVVVTEATLDYGSQAPIARAQMHTLGLDYPFDTVGPVSNTHDEALAVARLAKQRGWKRVLLVTTGWHMRRSAAVFEGAGLSVVCAPSVEGNYDINALDGPWDRLSAFRDWLHEIVGYQMYRWRGWIR